MPNRLSTASSVSSARTSSNATSAAVAPIGSMSTPSARRIGPVVPAGRTNRSSGPTTVGPVTTSTVARTIATSFEMPKISRAEYQPTIPVTMAPIVIRRRTTTPVLRSSRGGRSSPPSNRIRATDSETSGNSVLPSSSSGSSTPVTGPSVRPAMSSAMMDGSCVRHAIHCAIMPGADDHGERRPDRGLAGGEDDCVHEKALAIRGQGSPGFGTVTA